MCMNKQLDIVLDLWHIARYDNIDNFIRLIMPIIAAMTITEKRLLFERLDFYFPGDYVRSE